MAASSNFVRPTGADWTPTEPGVRRRVLTYNDSLMVVEVAFDSGAVGKLHRHPHIQASYVAEGAFEVTISGTTEVLTKGQSFIVPTDEWHGCRALEAGILIDTFTPMRAEFLEP
jgi:quercetin dioxygenase-like cupin family protein